jgi:hypothetical protein
LGSRWGLAFGGGRGAALGLEGSEILEGSAETAVYGGFVAEEGGSSGSREGVGEAAENGIGVKEGVTHRLGKARIDVRIAIVTTHGRLPGGLTGDAGVGDIDTVALVQVLGEGVALVQLQEGLHGGVEAITTEGEDGKVLDQMFFEGVYGLEAGTEGVEIDVGGGGEDGVVGGVSTMGEGVATADGLALGGAGAGRAAGVEAVCGYLGCGGDHEGTSC